MDVKHKFYDKKTKKINSFWRIPSNSEILKIENPYLEIQKENMPGLFELKLEEGKFSPNLAKNKTQKML